MTVTELAIIQGTTPDTVRYYTRLKLLHPKKSINGYKHYSERDAKRMKFILSARHLGFAVADIEQILGEAERGHSACPLVRTLIKNRLAETERQFQAMLALRNNMTLAIEQWEEMADKAPTSDMVCHLIERFDLATMAEKHHDE